MLPFLPLTLAGLVGCGEPVVGWPTVDTDDTSDTSDTTDTTDTADTNDTADTSDSGDTGDTNDTADTSDSNDTADSNDTGDTSDSNDTADTSDTAVGEPPVELGILDTFVVLAGAGLTNSNSSGSTTLDGDVALGPTGTCLGDGLPCTATNPVITGTLHAGDATAVEAQAALTVAYVDAMARPPGVPEADLAGLTLEPGVYTSASTMNIAVGGVLTLDAMGDADAVWIFQIGSSLTVGNNAEVVLVNGAQARNVFWAIFASSTLGTEVAFQGNILAGASNTVGTDSTVVGRLLCTTGVITLLSNTVTLP